MPLAIVYKCYIMLRCIIVTLTLCLILLAGAGLWTEMQRPVVTVYDVPITRWPANAPPLRIAFLSDTHVADPDMPPSRLTSIVAQTNALQPDCVLLGGDYLSDKGLLGRRYSDTASIAPFAHLTPRIATIAVLGNHDVGADGRASLLRQQLRRLGIVMPAGGVTRCGPLTVAGVDDPKYSRWQLFDAAAAVKHTRGPFLLLTHKPGDFFHKHAAIFPLVIAGHTHCGQIRVPGLGPVFGSGGVRPQDACGRSDHAGRTLIVGGGLGTSNLPIRLFTRPEIVLLRLCGQSRKPGPPRCSSD